jgi:sugar/nucleoside kinase (ribokinase family)
MIKRLVSLGSVIVDLVLEVPHLPERGADVLAAQRGMAAGGAFNVLSAAARLGLPGLYAGPHGTGPFGELVRAELEREGIAVSRVPTPDLDTGWTVAMIEPDGERTFVTVTGADAVVEPDALREIAYRDGDAVYVSGYDLAYPRAGAAIADHVAALDPRLFVAFDPGPLVAEIEPARLEAVLARVDMVSLNQRERALLPTVTKATVIVREGGRGATIHRAGSQPESVPAVKLERPVDTSGAGDVHVGANLAGLARGLGWPDAVLLANRAAAYAVSRPGPASGPTDAELRDFGAERW